VSPIERSQRLSVQKNSLDTQLPIVYNIHLTNRGFLIWRTKLQLKRPSRLIGNPSSGFCLLSSVSCLLPSVSCLLSSVSCLLLYPPILPSTLVETPLQIHLFFAKQSQCQNGQYKHKYSNHKGLCLRTTNNEQRTLPKTKPKQSQFQTIKAKSKPISNAQTAYPACQPGDWRSVFLDPLND
jgi:hypothetical protein